MDKPPNAYALERAMSVLLEARERLLALDPTIEEDQTLLADMLEGETGDAMAVVERLIEASVEADALAELAKQRKADLAERQSRFERRRDALRTLSLQALEALNLRRLERPAWTASIRTMPPPLIVDEEALDDRWFRLKREVDRAGLRKALASGDEPTGAQLGNPSTGLSVRTR